MNQLELMIRNHQVTEFRLTVYALGTVYVTFELGPGIPLRLTHGVLTCFEFAAYRSDISNALFKAAENRFVESDITKHNRRAVLTRRPGRNRLDRCERIHRIHVIQLVHWSVSLY